MNPTSFDDFAKNTLLSHAHEGTFVVSVNGEEEGADVARAFQVLGCTVEPEPFDLQLRITAPKAA
ncbi:hypothetical protein EON82_00365 [bacterium]|nr:MAG: hypothetical protein EON82_00365 [bacterium]